MILAVLGYGFIVLVLLGIIMGSPESPSPSIPATRTQTQSPIISMGFDLNQIAGIGLPIHDHWTEKDINDGKIVYIDLINKRNEAISPSNADIHGLTVKLRVLGLDSEGHFTIELFSRTYPNLNYVDITYPQGQNPIVIYYDEIKNYEFNEYGCCTGLSAEVTLPDERILKTNDIYDFDIKPTVVH